MAELDKTDVLKMKTMLISMLNEVKNHDLSSIIRSSELIIVPTRYDNWDHGTWYYEAILVVDFKIFKTLSDEQLELSRSTTLETLSKIFDSSTQVLEKVTIAPSIGFHIDWNSVKDVTSKESLINTIQREIDILIESSTGKHASDFLDEYDDIHKHNKEILQQLSIPHPLIFSSIWDWIKYVQDKENGLINYSSRRSFIKSKYESLLTILSESEEDIGLEIDYDITGWEIIDSSVQTLKNQLRDINDTIDFNEIGVRCRETIIMVAQAVYDASIHKPLNFDGEISSTDSSRMIEGFVNYKLSGRANKEQRTYVKSINNLVNKLVHSSGAKMIDAQLCITATISLISTIKLLDSNSSEN